MKIHTFTVVVGNKACNLRCPYCVSRMTPDMGVKYESPNLRNFEIACRFAEISDVTTVLFTGKGEPTLVPREISTYLSFLRNYYHFPFLELQCNGMVFDPHFSENILANAKEWYDLRLTLVCLSVAHYDAKESSRLLRPLYPEYDFWRAADALHDIGLSVRINCTLFQGGVDSPDSLRSLIQKSQEHGIEQITVRLVTKPEESEDEEVAAWVSEHQFDPSWIQPFVEESGGVHLLNLPHGARVYDYHGQNICISNCLTETTDKDDIRQMIFFPNGRITYSWMYPGAVIL